MDFFFRLDEGDPERRSKVIKKRTRTIIETNTKWKLLFVNLNFSTVEMKGSRKRIRKITKINETYKEKDDQIKKTQEKEGMFFFFFRVLSSVSAVEIRCWRSVRFWYSGVELQSFQKFSCYFWLMEIETVGIHQISFSFRFVLLRLLIHRIRNCKNSVDVLEVCSARDSNLKDRQMIRQYVSSASTTRKVEISTDPLTKNVIIS